MFRTLQRAVESGELDTAIETAMAKISVTSSSYSFKSCFYYNDNSLLQESLVSQALIFACDFGMGRADLRALFRLLRACHW